MIRKRRYLAIFLALAMIITIVPGAAASDDWNYTIDGENVTITGYTGAATNVIIPASLEGITVTKIGADAFYGNNIESVEIPRTINSIGMRAFQGCDKLSEVSFYGIRTAGESLNLTAQSIFSGCSQLTMESVNNILAENILAGILNQTFIYCTNVKGDLTIPAQITMVGGAFYQTGIESLSFEAGTTIESLGGNTFSDFAGCTSLKSVVLPSTIEAFGNFGVFSGCEALESFEFKTVNPPTMVNASTFSEIKSDCTFIVPAGADRGVWDSTLKSYGAPDGITVIKNLMINTDLLPVGYTGLAYSVTLSATGETPFCWEIASGSLPNGLSLDVDSGVISGMPTAKGTFPFTVKVTNDYGDSGTQALIMEIETNEVPDENLRAAINTKLGEADSAAPITRTQLESLTGNLLVNNQSVTNLAGMQYAKNLEIISLPNNQISDISPLSELTSLWELYLYNNQISNISSLSELTNLKHLSLYDNQISDISSLAGLTHLNSLNISDNQISDISSLSALIDQANFYASGQKLAVTAGTDVISNHLRAIDGAIVPITEDANAENTPENKIKILTFDTMTDPVTVQFTDSRSDISSKTYEFSGQLEITKGSEITPPSITTITLAGGTAGTPYSQALTARGDEPITCSIESGSLPAGLEMDASTGVISGTPTTVGTHNFTIKAANAGGDDTKALSIDIHLSAIVLPTITTTTLSDGKVGTAYSQTLAATGDEPITWRIESGSLPAGLELGTSTGVISGTPTTDGTYNFTVNAANAGGNDTKALTIVVNKKTTVSGGGGGGGAPTQYSITEGTIKNGSLSVDKTKASAGGKVIITVTPDQGYIFDKINVLDKDEREVKITKNSDGTYSFVMPSSNVTIDALFVKETPGSEETAPARPLKAFTDVKQGDWFYSSVQYVYEKGIMSGMSADTFGPDLNTSRAMIVTILYNLEEQPSADSSTFLDVQAGTWYFDAVSWAAGRGIVSGYGNDLFGPNDHITREQMAAILYNYAKFKGYDVSAASLPETFTDAGMISAWAQVPMAWAADSGLISGKGNGILDPGGNATRAEAATIIKNIIENLAG